MMTNLEQAVYLATTAITDRYPETCELKADERLEYYRRLIAKLQEMLPEDNQKEKELFRAMAATHECCARCVD